MKSEKMDATERLNAIETNIADAICKLDVMATMMDSLEGHRAVVDARNSAKTSFSRVRQINYRTESNYHYITRAEEARLRHDIDDFNGKSGKIRNTRRIVLAGLLSLAAIMGGYLGFAL